MVESKVEGEERRRQQTAGELRTKRHRPRGKNTIKKLNTGNQMKELTLEKSHGRPEKI